MEPITGILMILAGIGADEALNFKSNREYRRKGNKKGHSDHDYMSKSRDKQEKSKAYWKARRAIDEMKRRK